MESFRLGLSLLRRARSQASLSNMLISEDGHSLPWEMAPS